MSSFDFIILILLGLFTAIGALRGMLRESLSLLVWILALGGGWLFADAVASWFELLKDEELRRVMAFLVIVLSLLGVLSVAAFILTKLLPRPAPGLTDRALGAALGTLRGAVVVLVLVLLAGLTSLPNKPDWRDSVLVGLFQPAASRVLEWLPDLVARQFRYG